MKRLFLSIILVLSLDTSSLANEDMSNFAKAEKYNKLAQKSFNDVKNLKKAEKYYKLSCTSGNKKACSSYDSIKKAYKYLNNRSYMNVKDGEVTRTIGTVVKVNKQDVSELYYQMKYGKYGYEIEKKEKEEMEKSGVPLSFKKCKGCHGNGDIKAFGKSRRLTEMTVSEINKSLNDYKNGNGKNGSFKELMRKQAETLSSDDIFNIAKALGSGPSKELEDARIQAAKELEDARIQAIKEYKKIFSENNSKDYDFIIKDIDDNQLKVKISNNKIIIRGLENKMILIDIFATWCPPCKVMIPRIEYIKEKFKKDLIILSLSYEDIKNDKLSEFVLNNGMNTLVIKKNNATKLIDALGKLSSIPTIIGFNTKGKLIFKKAGIFSNDDLTKLVEKLK